MAAVHALMGESPTNSSIQPVLSGSLQPVITGLSVTELSLNVQPVADNGSQAIYQPVEDNSSQAIYQPEEDDDSQAIYQPVEDDGSQAMEQEMSTIDIAPILCQVSEYNMGADIYVDPAQYYAPFEPPNQEPGVEDESSTSRERVLSHLNTIVQDRISLEVEEFRGSLMSILDEQMQNVRQLMQIFQSPQSDQQFDSQTESEEIRVDFPTALSEGVVGAEPVDNLATEMTFASEMNGTTIMADTTGITDTMGANGAMEVNGTPGRIGASDRACSTLETLPMDDNLQTPTASHRECCCAEDLRNQYLLQLFMASSKIGAMLTRKEFRT